MHSGFHFKCYIKVKLETRKGKESFRKDALLRYLEAIELAGDLFVSYNGHCMHASKT